MTDHSKSTVETKPGFFVPPGHKLFSALLIAERVDDQIGDCLVAHIDPGGGGPMPDHTHEHDHLFVVLDGSVDILIDGTTTTLLTYQSMLVPGNALHSVWNTSQVPAKVFGISLNPTEGT